MNKNHIRGTTSEMRRQISSKSKTCPEGRCVDVARTSREVGSQYPGRSRALPLATAAERRREGVQEVNETKSRVVRPWESKFLGCSMTMHRSQRLKIAGESVERFKAKVRQLIGKGRGRNLECFIVEDLNPQVRGWANYYKETKTYDLFVVLPRKSGRVGRKGLVV